MAAAYSSCHSRWRRLLVWLLGGLAVSSLALVGVGALFFSGPYRTPTTLPRQPVIDLHVHTAGIGAGDSGCFISRELERSWKFNLYLKAFGTTREELAAKGDASLIGRIAAEVAGSTHVTHAVVLAMDGAVNAAGELDRTATEIHVPNEFVAREVARHTHLLFGASVNPYRKDALARLDWCATNGAVLVKWIPSLMHIDPADERLVPFYERLKHHQLPLLTHAGQERSFTHADDRLADPERLRLPLRLGVTIIAAHIASTGENEGERDTDRLAKLMAEFPNLYSEISSLTQANKLGYLKEALTRPEFEGRLCYGSDFPLSNTALVSPWLFRLNLTGEQLSRLSALANPWDRDVALKQALGVPDTVFARTETLLAPRLANRQSRRE
jgi:predicted TIM-barrel fold metal-dependent hydrolase